MALSSETAKLIAQLVLDDKLTPGALKALGTVDKMERGFGRAGKGAGQLGMGLLKLGAVAAGAAAVGLAGAGKAAIDFEDAFAGIRKTVDETDLSKAGLSFDDIRKSMLNLSTTIPITASDLARLGEAAGALGVGVKDIAAFAEVTAKLGVTTNLTADEAANALGKIGTILGLTGKEYETFGDILVNLGNKGASTEAEIIEITKRFAAAGVSAGLSTPQILGFASAIASAGIEPEAAGSSLSRLFGNLVKETALATDKAKAFAKVSGKSFKDFANIVEDDTNGAMLLFLENLGKLDKFDQAKALKAVGITAVRDINAIRLLAQTYDKNLIPALRNAADSAGALDEESTKKFDTIKQKWQLLKNAFTKGGIEMGEGFLPALGRLTTKVTAWVNTNSGKLQQVGRDIGKSIDDINWSEVESGAKRVGDAASTILDVIKQIPTELKVAGVAFIGLDKLSGGNLSGGIGNIAGGAADVAFKQFLGRGSPANPMYVVPVGGGLGGGKGGIPPVAAGGGLLAGLAAIAVPVLAVTAVAGAAKLLQDRVDEQAAGVNAKASAFAPRASDADLARSIDGLRKQVDSMPFNTFDSKNKVVETLNILIAEQNRRTRTGQAGPAPVRMVGDQPDRTDPAKIAWRNAKRDAAALAVENLRRDISPSLSKTPVKLDAVKASIVEAGIKAKNAGVEVKTATRAAGITAALGAKNAGATVRASTIAAGLAAQRAGDRVSAAARAAGVNAARGGRAGGAISAAAVRAKRMSFTSNVTVRTVIDSREWLRQATQTNIRGGAS